MKMIKTTYDDFTNDELWLVAEKSVDVAASSAALCILIQRANTAKDLMPNQPIPFSAHQGKLSEVTRSKLVTLVRQADTLWEATWIHNYYSSSDPLVGKAYFDRLDEALRSTTTQKELCEIFSILPCILLSNGDKSRLRQSYPAFLLNPRARNEVVLILFYLRYLYPSFYQESLTETGRKATALSDFTTHELLKLEEVQLPSNLPYKEFRKAVAIELAKRAETLNLNELLYVNLRVPHNSESERIVSEKLSERLNDATTLDKVLHFYRNVDHSRPFGRKVSAKMLSMVSEMKTQEELRTLLSNGVKESENRFEAGRVYSLDAREVCTAVYIRLAEVAETHEQLVSIVNDNSVYYEAKEVALRKLVAITDAPSSLIQIYDQLFKKSPVVAAVIDKLGGQESFEIALLSYRLERIIK
jgi:hypothetical protein